MRKFEAIGVVETQYYTIAMELLDHMCKSTGVEFLSSEKYLGGRLVSLIVAGSVSDVTEAVEVARRVCQNKEGHPLKMALVISNPHSEILKYIIPADDQETTSGAKLEIGNTEEEVILTPKRRGRKPKTTQAETKEE
jgi:ethanolamine utilization protein EutM